eukprot:6729609-Alexandrium_andersonii.AAC.1
MQRDGIEGLSVSHEGKARVRLPDTHHGYERNRGREGAIIVHMCMAWRLVTSRCSYVRAHYDLSNAFMTPSHECMQSAVPELVCPEDCSLFADCFLQSSVML